MNKKALAVTALICAIVVGLTASFSGVLQPSSTSQRTIVAFCGAASKPILEEAAPVFEENMNVSIELHFSGSGTMLAQMMMSKTGDVYIPGSHDYMVTAIDKDLVDPTTVKVFAYVIPAIIVQEGNPKDIRTLEDLGKPGVRVGIGDPGSVCVGQYAVEILEYNGLKEDVEKNIVVHAESCSKTLALVTMGQVDAIIGWRVFERWNPDKTEVILIEPERIPKISCIPGAISTNTQNRQDGENFLNYLASKSGQEFFRKYGYIVTLEEARVYAPYAEIPQF